MTQHSPTSWPTIRKCCPPQLLHGRVKDVFAIGVIVHADIDMAFVEFKARRRRRLHFNAKLHFAQPFNAVFVFGSFFSLSVTRPPWKRHKYSFDKKASSLSLSAVRRNHLHRSRTSTIFAGDVALHLMPHLQTSGD